ncbi:M23 family metallopeptidase [Microaerobacter geothermalis]|uniref:LysM peptidoglycan-binding domain-containing M23 family metallopeptidase n=1 Tax=Microaerobacter geothermalis TaxID=674972 RepID=UPI001F4174BC|nr:M23 family metallopeptidase [Microaerobacter geothermalis]MCF6094652.1 M23 family metallopeptidase [Microaerobacter geothermalis]
MSYVKKMGDWIRGKTPGLFGYIRANKKAAIASVSIVTVLATGSLIGNQYYQSQVNTLYHVFLKGQEIGVASDPSVVENWIAEQNKLAQQKYKDMDVSFDSDITYKSERVYKGQAEDDKVLSVLEKSLEVKADAVKVVINGEFLGYAKDQETLNKILEEVKSTYLPQTAAEEGIEGKEKRVQIASLANNEEKTDLLEVDIKENIDVQNETVSPDKILSEDQLKSLFINGTEEQVIHKVEKGEYLGLIAEKYNVKVADILKNNPGLTEETLLQIGQEINVTALQPKVTVKTVEKVTRRETIDYDVEVRQDDSMFRGETRIVQNGKEGLKIAEYKVTKENGDKINEELLNEEVIEDPITKIVIKGTKLPPAKGSGRFIWPTNGGIITSGYGPRWGEFHAGLDIAGAKDLNILASDSGVVEFVGWSGGWGKRIIIDHGNGWKTAYSHLSRFKVSEGDKVGKGQVIAIMGNTGRSTGVHLDFQILKNGVPVNPLNYVSR